MIVIGLDPGTEESAIVAYNGTAVTGHRITQNEDMREWTRSNVDPAGHVLVIEEFESFGMAVGREVFRTIRWAGNFEEAFGPERVKWLPRRTVKQHICHTARATDANIRQELLDRFGGKAAALGSKKAPGPLYGLKSHEWSALALAITWFDQFGHLQPDIRPGIQPEF